MRVQFSWKIKNFTSIFHKFCEISWKTIVEKIYRGVFMTLSNINDGTFFEK